MKTILTGSTGNLGSQIHQLKDIQFLTVNSENWTALDSIQDSEYQSVIHCA